MTPFAVARHGLDRREFKFNKTGVQQRAKYD